MISVKSAQKSDCKYATTRRGGVVRSESTLHKQ